MIVISPRAMEGLKAVLGRRLADEGEPDHHDTNHVRTLVHLTRLVADFAEATRGPADLSGKQLLRATLLEVAAACVRGVMAIDKYDLAVHWKEQDHARARS